MHTETISSRDGLELRVARWEPPDEVAGQLVLVHGLGEHLGRYDYVATQLAAAGWRVSALDLRGHGESGGKRGHVDAWSDYLNDLRALVATVDGPFVLLAHSMGGLVVLDYLRDATGVRAAVLSGPAVGVAVPIPGWKNAGARVLTRLLPRLSMDNEIDPQWICSDPAVVSAYQQDPLVFSTVTPRWFTEMLTAVDRVHAHAPRYDIPMWIGWGEGDRLVSTEALARLAKAIPSATARPWPGLYHEILNEPVRDDILAEILAWLADLG